MVVAVLTRIYHLLFETWKFEILSKIDTINYIDNRILLSMIMWRNYSHTTFPPWSVPLGNVGGAVFRWRARLSGRSGRFPCSALWIILFVKSRVMTSRVTMAQLTLKFVLTLPWPDSYVIIYIISIIIKLIFEHCLRSEVHLLIILT